MNHYARHIGDYLKDTSHLSLLEHGIYTRLLDVYYTKEGAIPDAQAARLMGARTKEEKEALQAVLSEFFTLETDGWHQKRADAEIERYQEKARRNREVGATGGRPRTQTVSKQKPRNNPDGFQNETQTEPTDNQGGSKTEPTDNPSHKPLANSHKPEASSQGKDSPETESLSQRERSRASRLPDLWTPSPEQVSWALAERPDWSEPDVQRVAERFSDHWRAAPGEKGRKADWDATWRNWVRRESTAARTPGRSASTQDEIERLNRSIAAGWTPPGGQQ